MASFDSFNVSELMSETEQLYSRQLNIFGGTTGIHAIKNSEVLILGATPVGIEVAKNLLCMGIEKLTIHDEGVVEERELAANYCLDENSVGKKRVEVCIPRLRQLVSSHLATRVVGSSEKITSNDFYAPFQVVVACDQPLASLVPVNKYCRENKKHFVATLTYGLLGTVFVDGGDSFTFEPSNNRVQKRIIGASLENENLLITVSEENHELNDGDRVVLHNLHGIPSLNSKEFIIRSAEKSSQFWIDSVTLAADEQYVDGGYFVQLPNTRVDEFKSLEQNLENPQFSRPFFRPSGRPTYLQPFISLLALSNFQEKNKTVPSSDDWEAVSEVAKQLAEKYNVPLNESFLRTALSQARGSLCPIATFFGGIAAQEVTKLCVHLHQPIKQWLQAEFFDCIPSERDEPSEHSRYLGQENIFGNAFQERLANRNIFLVGAGALGCELVKNFALMGVSCGSNGRISLTDPDIIELSNLNRQFLFTREHKGKFKSVIAAEVAKTINKDIRITAYTNEVHEEQRLFGEFTDKFISPVTEIIAAVDNMKARRYLNRLAHLHMIPFLESGTKGLVCASHTVLPFRTLPFNEKDITDATANCTPKYFVYQPQHLIEKARKSFDKLFKANIELLAAFEEGVSVETDADKEKVAKLKQCCEEYHALRQHKEKRSAFAKSRLEHLINLSIQRILDNHPEDKLDDQGKPFWGGQRICPRPLVVDLTDSLQAAFCESVEKLLDRIFANDSLSPQSFEKDDQLHLKFMWATTNLLTRIYKFPELSVQQVHQKSGSIIPAVITTTSVIVGLVCLELYKVVSRSENIASILKEYSVNLSNPFVATSTLRDASHYLKCLESEPFVKIDADINVPMRTLVDLLHEKYFLKLRAISFKDPTFRNLIYPLLPGSKLSEETNTFRDVLASCRVKIGPEVQYVVLDLVLETDDVVSVQLRV